jgi:uncharacterized protein (TIGR02147 family)
MERGQYVAEEKTMLNIFNYLDYREFIEDFYEDKKAANPHFSFQVFASMAGFGSKSFIKLVIDGKKNLTEKSVEQVNRALKLTDKSFSYFKDLVGFNQASSLQLRNFYFERILSYNKRNSAKALLHNQYDFYTKWYHNTIRELACTVNFKDNFELLGKMVKPAISARKARQSVALLQKLGLIRRKTGGGYEQSDAIITTGNEVRSLAVQNFHQQNLFIAGQSIETVASSERDISCLILGLSENGIQRIKGEIHKFQDKLLEIARHEKDIDRVCHLNFQLFPTSERINEKP